MTKTIIATLVAGAALVLVCSNAQPNEKDEPKVKIKDDKVGNGAEAKKGDTLEVHYTGTLKDGTKFDSSKDRNKTFEFKLGAGMVIKGWDQGLVGMKVGGVRTLTIPPELGYGARGAGDKIPPNAELTFKVELVNIR